MDCRRSASRRRPTPGPRRHFDPPPRGSVDADRTVDDGAAIAPVIRSGQPPAPTPETTASGETHASLDRALVAPAYRFACHPASQRISRASVATGSSRLLVPDLVQ